MINEGNILWEVNLTDIISLILIYIDASKVCGYF